MFFFLMIRLTLWVWGFPVDVGHEELANAGDIRDAGLIHGLGRSRGGHSDHSSILAWRIPHGQRSLAGYGPCGHKESDVIGATYHACRHGFEVRQEK